MATDDEDALDGPFGRPLFDNPSLRALRRVGVIDVGSNSVRLVVFDGAARSPAYFYNEKILCGLGAGLGETGRLNPEGRTRALAALRRFAMVTRGIEVTTLSAVATAAVREAADGPAFRDEVLAETGIRLWVADGDTEARLSAQGVLLGWPGARGLVCDMGGSSMELAEVSGGHVGRRLTTDLAPLKLIGMKGGRKAMRAHARERLAEVRKRLDGEYDHIYLVGGSWRAIARLDMARRDYPLTVLHEYEMKPRSILQTIKWLQGKDLGKLRARTGTSAERMRLVPIAGEVLRELLRAFEPRRVAVSSYGLREGLLYEQMPDELRRRDPLIEAARHAERTSARFPGFGKVLYRFVEPLFANAKMDRLRLVKAACLLHDVNWRAHPDYRAEVCFDTATWANLGGLDHKGRVFLGLALLHRYKNTRAPGRLDRLLPLLDDEGLRAAEVLGKAMRFGAMFSAQNAEMLGALRLHPRKKVLVFQLPRRAADLYGEVAEARLGALAKALGCTPEVEMV
ncbi:MAG: Ppx/GppA family phosphatase [Alphaproteobacteria bacterium]|nr:MAG: Ppx/GppA family phosphatase [Alphaproteobacteria bacterium]